MLLVNRNSNRIAKLSLLRDIKFNSIMRLAKFRIAFKFSDVKASARRVSFAVPREERQNPPPAFKKLYASCTKEEKALLGQATADRQSNTVPRQIPS